MFCVKIDAAQSSFEGAYQPMKPENLGKKFVEVNRALTWAETPEEWNPAIQKMDAFLDEIKDLGPATLENLCAWVWKRLSPTIPKLFRIAIYRDSSGEMCSYCGPHGSES